MAIASLNCPLAACRLTRSSYLAILEKKLEAKKVSQEKQEGVK